MSLREYLKLALPAPLIDRVRSSRDALRVSLFKGKTVTHQYGDITLKVRIADPIAADWYDKQWSELPEITFLKQSRLRPGARVFDIGAHQAVFAIWMAKIVGETGSVVALEPGDFNYKIAMENKSLNRADNLTLRNAAISERTGQISFLNCLNGKISPSGNTVECFTIDALTELYGEPDVVFVDVEGYEWLALQASTSTMQTAADWYIEVHVGCGLESFGGSAARIVDLFRSAGYSLYCQTDVRYQHPFVPLKEVPEGRFFLIATRSGLRHLA